MSGQPKRLYFRLSTLLLLVTVFGAIVGAARFGYQSGYATGHALRQREHVVTRLYDVNDLVAEPRARHSLAEFLLNNVEPGSWEDSGGSGTIHWFEGPPLMLVVTQSGGAHDQIAAYLERIRSNQRQRN